MRTHRSDRKQGHIERDATRAPAKPSPPQAKSDQRLQSEVEEDALKRAESEIRSGEFDVQG